MVNCSERIEKVQRVNGLGIFNSIISASLWSDLSYQETLLIGVTDPLAKTRTGHPVKVSCNTAYLYLIYARRLRG